jgi:hypothetical protein
MKMFSSFLSEKSNKKSCQTFYRKISAILKTWAFFAYDEKKFLTIFDFLTSFACKPNLKMDVEDELQHSH